MQFNNCSLWETATWDYAADTRGCTYGITAELTQGKWTHRLGTFLEPLESNGIHLDRDIRHAHGDAFELQHDHVIARHPGKVRGMVFVNHARMGSYRQALDENPSAPDVMQRAGAGESNTGSV